MVNIDNISKEELICDLKDACEIITFYKNKLRIYSKAITLLLKKLNKKELEEFLNEDKSEKEMIHKIYEEVSDLIKNSEEEK